MKSTFFTFLLAAVLIFSGCNKSAEFETIFNGKDQLYMRFKDIELKKLN